MLLNPNRLMSDVFDVVRQDVDRLLAGPRGMVQAARLPAANIWETADALIVEMETPGVSAEHVDVNVVNDELTIRGRREIQTPENATAHRRERAAGQFERVFGLPFAIDADKVEANLINGVLTVRLPKAATAMPRKVSVRNG